LAADGYDSRADGYDASPVATCGQAVVVFIAPPLSCALLGDWLDCTIDEILIKSPTGFQ
jgi:hypothetical protein